MPFLSGRLVRRVLLFKNAISSGGTRKLYEIGSKGHFNFHSDTLRQLESDMLLVSQTRATGSVCAAIAPVSALSTLLVLPHFHGGDEENCREQWMQNLRWDTPYQQSADGCACYRAKSHINEKIDSASGH